MKIYSKYGFDDFVLCCGYKSEVIREYFLNYVMNMSDTTIDFSNSQIEFHSKPSENWRVTLVDTGEGSMTGGRMKRVADFVKDDDAFFSHLWRWTWRY
jgi:glucose-1-phosphate cytidylyltransferase